MGSTKQIQQEAYDTDLFIKRYRENKARGMSLQDARQDALKYLQTLPSSRKYNILSGDAADDKERTIRFNTKTNIDAGLRSFGNELWNGTARTALGLVKAPISMATFLPDMAITGFNALSNKNIPTLGDRLIAPLDQADKWLADHNGNNAYVSANVRKASDMLRNTGVSALETAFWLRGYPVIGARASRIAAKNLKHTLFTNPRKAGEAASLYGKVLKRQWRTPLFVNTPLTSMPQAAVSAFKRHPIMSTIQGGFNTHLLYSPIREFSPEVGLPFNANERDIAFGPYRELLSSAGGNITQPYYIKDKEKLKQFADAIHVPYNELEQAMIYNATSQDGLNAKININNNILMNAQNKANANPAYSPLWKYGVGVSALAGIPIIHSLFNIGRKKKKRLNPLIPVGGSLIALLGTKYFQDKMKSDDISAAVKSEMMV